MLMQKLVQRPATGWSFYDPVYHISWTQRNNTAPVSALTLSTDCGGSVGRLLTVLMASMA